MKEFIVVIPARYQSSRLPGKPLIKIAGMSMIERTWSQCCKVVDTSNVIIATDDKRIADHVESFGGRAIMTPENCKTGTDRLAYLLDLFPQDYFINVQGDEPIMNPKDLTLMIGALDDTNYEIINGYSEITSEQDFRSPNIPKVICNERNELLYMSRAPIPARKDLIFEKAWRQVCIYAYSRKALKAFAAHNFKTVIEEIEDIEILRFLETGFSIKMLKMSSNSIAVDIPEDIERVEAYLKRQSNE